MSSSCSGIFDAVVCRVCQKCVPIHQTNPSHAKDGRRTCVGCSKQEVHEEPIIYCSTPETPLWIEALGLVHFDLLLGQVLEVLYPPLPLSASQETEVSFLCFPDANHVVDGDSIHDVVFAYNLSECDPSRTAIKRVRTGNGDEEEATRATSAVPPTPSSPLQKQPFDSTSTEMFCSTLFRQRKDSSIERGAQQQALLVMSRYPFPSVSHQVLRILCALTFDTPGVDPATVLQQAYEEIRQWPPPLPTNRYQLTLMGRELSPYTTPVYTAAQVEHLRWSETRIHSSIAGASRRNLMDALVAPNASWSTVKDLVHGYVHSAGCSVATRKAITALTSGSDPLQAPPRAALLAMLRCLLYGPEEEGSGGKGEPIDTASNTVDAKAPEMRRTVDNLMRHFRHSADPLLQKDVVSIQNEALEHLQRRALHILASPELTQSECRDCGPHRGHDFFSELEFHHAMRPHLPKLWKLWELMIVGAPIAVMSYDAPTVTTACLSLTTLIAPLRFVGVLRPYVTINNREVDLFVTEPAPPSVVFGTTNPFFVRRCVKWPHFLCLARENDEPITHKMLPSDSEKREKQQFKMKNRMFCSRHFLIKTEKTMTDIAEIGSPPKGKGSFVDLNPSSIEGSSMRQLRQHFLELTEEFLAPLKYIIRTTLRNERPFFVPAERERLLGTDALLKALSQFSGPMPLSCFKNRADMLTVYREFLDTNTFRVWNQDQYDYVFREVLLSVASLEELLLMNPDPMTRHIVLQSVQDHFDQVISRPIVDLTLAQKLSALCSLIPLLREHLAS